MKVKAFYSGRDETYKYEGELLSDVDETYLIDDTITRMKVRLPKAMTTLLYLKEDE